MNTVQDSYKFSGGQHLELVQGDITTEKVDAIVNAANSRLMHAGGLAAIISRKGGGAIQQESAAWVRAHGPVSHSEPAYTSAGSLPCSKVIHAVGPVWGSGDEAAKLASAVRGSLALAERLELTSIAFPAISTGIFGFPKDLAAKTIFAAIRDYFREHPSSRLMQVRITLFDQPTSDAFTQVWKGMHAEDE
ncbi:MAG: macro domain-containing protein [Chloroflexi bacterium]|nr:macro domain-containing protein [Chloroflexota bacterium]